MTVDVGIALPQALDECSDPTHLAAYCSWLEGLGFDGLWVSDSDTPGAFDPLSVLSCAAGATERVRLGVAVLLTPLREPVQLARLLATIDQLSGGRLDVGVGLGGSTEAYPRHGLSADRRVQRYTQGLELLRRLWSEELVTSHTPWWQIDGMPRPLTPVQRPHPPVWFGARRSPALRRAAWDGDGWIGAGSMTSVEFAEALHELEQHLRAAGRDRETYVVSKRVYVHVHDDGPTPPVAVRQWFSRHYGDELLADRFAVVGGASACADQLLELVALGLDHVILHPVANHSAQVQLLVEQVLPAAGLPLAVPRFR